MTRRPSRRLANPSFDTLETRMMLSATPAAAASAKTDANQRYVDALLIGSDLSKPALASMRDKLVSALDHGVSRQRVVMMLNQSPAADQARVADVYHLVLDRDPTSQELRRGQTVLNNGQDVRALTKNLADSNEFYRQLGGGTPVGFVTALDHVLLHRDPSSAELARASTTAASPAGRRRLVATIINGQEYRTNLAQHTLSVTGQPVTAQALTQAVRQLATPQGFLRLQAGVMSSPAVYKQLSTAPTTPPPTTTQEGSVSANSLSGIMPSLTSGFAGVTLPPAGQALTIATAGSDGSYYLGGSTGLSVYSPAQGTWSSTGDGLPVLSASAVSANEIWTIEQPASGLNPVLVHYLNNQQQTAALPGNAVPMQVSAASDGTVWVVDSTGSIFTLSSASTYWTPMAGPGGATVTAVAVGSASNTWALSGAAGASQLYRFTTQDGWIPDPTFPPGQVTSIYACADGSAWLVANGHAYLHTEFGYWSGVNNTSIPMASFDPFVQAPTLQSLAPSSQFQAYTILEQKFLNNFPPPKVLFLSSTVGLVDQDPDTSFPTWTSVQQEIYNYMSTTIQGSQVAGGLRAYYDDLAIDLTDVRLDLQALPIPTGTNGQPLYSTTDWNSVISELDTELQASDDVRGLFTQVDTLDSNIEGEQALVLPGIVSTIAAGNPGPSNSSTLDVALAGLFEGLVAAVASTTGVGGVVAGAAGAFIGSALNSAVSDVESNSGGTNSNNQLAIQYGEFSTTLANVFTQAAANNANYETSILSDYGRLTAADALIANQTWDWTPETLTTLGAATETTFTLNDYQTLVPAQWQIVQFQGTVPWWYNKSVYDYWKIPQSASIVSLLGYDNNGDAIYNIKFSNMVGASTNIFGSNNYGPFITSSLLNTLGSLPGQSVNDYWNRSNGWQNVRYTFVTQ